MIKSPSLPATRPDVAALAELVARLRQDVIDRASEATLTCRFVPGGRLNGAGIVSHFYCSTCNKSQIWHDVAAAIRELAREESC